MVAEVAGLAHCVVGEDLQTCVRTKGGIRDVVAAEKALSMAIVTLHHAARFTSRPWQSKVLVRVSASVC